MAAPLDPRLAGVSPVLAVAFHDNGDLDPLGFTAIVDHVLAAGVTSALMFGLASEFHKLTDFERDELGEILLDRTAGHPGFAAICSVTDHATHVAVRRAKRYEARGAAAVNVLPPHFLGPSTEAVVAHLDAVMDAVSVPVVLQYAPIQTGTLLRPDDLGQLASRHHNFRIVKVECNPPGPMIAALADLGLQSFVGQAGVHLPSAVAAGAIGVQPGCSMVPLYQQMWLAAATGDAKGLALVYAELLPVLSHWMTGVETIVQAEKTVLHRLGVIGADHCRAPGARLDPYAFALVDQMLERLRKGGRS